MIDLTNAPEGATHYIDGNGLVFYKKTFCGTWMAHCGRWEVSGNSSAYNDAKCKAIPCKEWTIYSNTKPLSELSDEQRGLLFNHHCNGGQLQNSQHGGSEIDVFYDTDSWSIWSLNTIYRAKQKSERELFIDAAFNTCPVFADTKYDHEQLLNAMFDAGFKAPKVGE